MIQVLHMLWEPFHMLWMLASAHPGVLSILGIAFVVHMPLSLPYPFSKVPVLAWGWTWMRDGLIEFVSRKSVPSQPPTPPETDPHKQ